MTSIHELIRHLNHGQRQGDGTTMLVGRHAVTEAIRLLSLLGETQEALAACQSEGAAWKLLAGNLAVWVTRLARQLPAEKPSLRREAMEFLKAHSLVRPLRDDTTTDKSTPRAE